MTENLRQRLALLRLLPQISRSLTAVLFGCVTLSALAPVGFAVASGVVVGSVPVALQQGLDSPAGQRMTVALLAAAGLFVIQQVLGPTQIALADTLGRRVDGLVRARAMRACLAPTGIAHLEDPAVLDKAELTQGALDGTFTPGGAVLGITSNTSTTAQSLGSAVLVATFNVPLAVSLFAVWRFLRSTVLRDFLRQVNVLSDQTQPMRRADYFREMAMAPGGAKELRIFGLSAWVGRRFTLHWMAGMTKVWEERKGRRLPIIVSLAAVAAGNLAGVWMVGRAGIAGTLDLERVAILLQAILGVGALSISDGDMHIAYGLAALPALDDLESRTRAGRPDAGGRDPSGLPRQGVRFEKVSFSYPGRDDQVFSALDLELPAGRSLAIVGENGAGKTTLVKLLARLYEPTSGRITVDGIDLRDLDARQWQQRVAAIFQDFVRYELPARDNVRYGAPTGPGGDRELERAAQRAGAARIIAGLAHGWDTILSRRFSKGADLSGGEWQRIALARALYAVEAGAGVLVLDEPTANLDVRAEAEIYDRFLELTQGLTTIVVSHRFSTVRRADRIVVLEHGRVVEDGSHEELLALGGRYATMFGLQAARFADPDVGSEEAPADA